MRSNRARAVSSPVRSLAVINANTRQSVVKMINPTGCSSYASSRSSLPSACAWRGADGRRLWQRYKTAREPRRVGAYLCGRHHAEYLGLDARHGAAAAEEVVGSGSTAEADPSRRQAPADLGQGARPWSSREGLAHDQVA